MFTVCEKFDATCGERWEKFLGWSGFHHLNELVSIDGMLCPSLVEDLTEEDWNHNVDEDKRYYFFRDWKYLVDRVGYDPARHNLLSITVQPDRRPEPLEGFTFCGYDIADTEESVSVLTNCGAFSSIYGPADLNELGLVSDLDRATQIAAAIRESNPDEHHCSGCQVWGLSRFDKNSLAPKS